VGKFSLRRLWRLRGWDTFAAEAYPIGRYFTEAGALRAARRNLRQLSRDQPPESSGGQGPPGIQDRVYIVRPDGTEFRVPDQPE
jgi:hypothetical protein